MLNDMNWREKMRRLVKGRNASELSRAAGLNPSAIGAAVSKGNLPKADKAIRIARALGVSSDWLFDDEREWPPPNESPLDDIPHSELVRELARRRQAIRRDMLALAGPFTDERLIHLNRLATFSTHNESQKSELDAALQSLLMCDLYARQLLWLDPDEAHPHQTTVLSGTQIVQDFPGLAKRLNDLISENTSRFLGTPSMSRRMNQAAQNRVPRYDLKGETFPEPPEVTGRIVTEELTTAEFLARQAAKKEAANRRRRQGKKTKDSPESQE